MLVGSILFLLCRFFVRCLCCSFVCLFVAVAVAVVGVVVIVVVVVVAADVCYNRRHPVLDSQFNASTFCDA